MLLSLLIFVIAVLLGAILFAIAVVVYRQNLPLLQNFRNGSRNFKSILSQALLVWSPMGLVIILLLFLAAAISQGMTELAYRYTTLDKFCEVQGVERQVYIACTGMGNVLKEEDVVRVDPKVDLKHQIFHRYSEIRKKILETPTINISENAGSTSSFLSTLSPSSIFSLPPSIDSDVLLSRLIVGRRQLFESPIPMPTDLAELLSYRQSVETRNRLLKEMDVAIATRTKIIFVREYGSLTPEQRLQRQRKNQLFQLLREVKVEANSDMQRILSPSAGNSPVNRGLIKQRLVRLLAHSERDAWKILSRELANPNQVSTVYDVLGMVPRCTVAKSNAALRLNPSDFDTNFSNLVATDNRSSTLINGGSFACFERLEPGKSLKLSSVGFRKSVMLSIDRMRDEIAFSAFEKLDALEAKLEKGTVEAEAANLALTNLIPNVIPLGRQKCGVFNPVNCVMNGITSSAEAAYTHSRAELLAQSMEQTTTAADFATMAVQEKIDYARVNTDDDVERFRVAGYLTAESLFKLNDLLRVLAWIGLLLITLRSFFYVLALELFDRNGESRISFDVESPVEGSYVAGAVVTINAEFPHPIINRGSLTNTLADIKFAPWPWSSPFSRILHGCYFLFNWSVFSPPKLKASANDVKGMEASARKGYSIVEWRMQPGEEVVFHYKDFYGASANVQLKTDISLRLSTLLLGRVFFHYARCSEGEGRLLLEARIHNTPRDSISSIKPARLVAWSRHAQFSADSHRRPWKTLINPYTIVREFTPGVPKGLVIIAPESETPQFFGMGVQFIKRIFSRIF